MYQMAGHMHKIYICKEASQIYAQRRKRQRLQTGVRVLFKRHCFIKEGRDIPCQVLCKIFSISNLIYTQRITRRWRLLPHIQTGNLLSLLTLSINHHNSTCKFQCKSMQPTSRLCFADQDVEINVNPLLLPSTFKTLKKPISIACQNGNYSL